MGPVQNLLTRSAENSKASWWGRASLSAIKLGILAQPGPPDPSIRRNHVWAPYHRLKLA